MYQLSGIEYKIILKEINEKVKGRFQKAYMKEDRFRMKIGKWKISAIMGKAIYIGDNKENNSNFLTQKIRKELKGLWFKEAEQINEDRIIKFNFDNNKALIFEMFGKGNIILTENNIILMALHERDWATRSIRKGKQYQAPPKKEYKEKIAKLIARGLRKEWAETLSNKSDQEIEEEINKLLNKKFDLKNNNIIEGTRTLSEVLEEYYLINKEEKKDDKQERIREKQLEYLKELEQKAKEAREKANLILANINYVQELIEKAKKGEIEVNKKEKTFEIEL